MSAIDRSKVVCIFLFLVFDSASHKLYRVYSIVNIGASHRGTCDVMQNKKKILNNLLKIVNER